MMVLWPPPFGRPQHQFDRRQFDQHQFDQSQFDQSQFDQSQFDRSRVAHTVDSTRIAARLVCCSTGLPGANESFIG